MFSENNYTQPPYYGGIGVDYEAIGGVGSNDDKHCLNLFFSTNNTVEMSFSNGSAPPANIGKQIKTEYKDGTYIYYYNTFEDSIIDYFNSKFKNQICFYIYEDPQDGTGESSLGMKKTEDKYNPDRHLKDVARVWLKSIDGWAIFSTPMEKLEYGSNPWNFIKRYLFKNYNTVIYCFSDSVSCGIAKIATPDNTKYIYNTKYILNSPLTINCTISNTNIIFGNNIQCSNGQQILKNIEFKKENENSSIEKSINSVTRQIEKAKNNAEEDTISNNIQINKDMKYSNEAYGILWKGTQTSPPPLRYDVTGWGHDHHWTLFDYSGIKTINNGY